MARPLVLASASPRRRELLERVGLAFDIVPADVDESIVSGATRVESIPRQLAALKARTVAKRLPNAVVLAADTIVVLNCRMLGKPESPDDARRMLRDLRDRWHLVITGVAVTYDGHMRIAHARTRVKLRGYSASEIEASIARGDPFDKAGGYAIQDEQLDPVSNYDGCYCNVVGLPVGLALRMLSDAGVDLVSDHADRRPSQCAQCQYDLPS